LAVTLFVFVAIAAFGAALSVSVALMLGVLNKLDGLIGVHVDVTLTLHSECLANLGDLLVVKFVRESDLEDNKEVSAFVGLFMEGKTLVCHRLNVVGLDHFAGVVLDSQLGAVKVSDHEVHAG